MNHEIQRLINNGQFKLALERAEQTIYLLAYARAGYNQVAAAKLLGVSRGKLRERLSRWDG